MTQIQRVSPSVVDGIEFYVSHDGKEVGLSQRGLARLCGIDESSLRRLLVRVEKGDTTLNSLQGGLFSCGIEGTNKAKIITSEAAVAIIEHYAFTSTKKNELALFTFRKFAHLGFDLWVKDITGYAVDQNQEAILSTMQEILTELKETKAITQEYQNLRKVTVQVYPGLDSMLDSLPNTHQLPATELITVKEWLKDTKGITLTHDRICALGRLVADTYKSMTGKQPRNKVAKVEGKWVNVGKGYAPEHYPLLETAWKQFSA